MKILIVYPNKIMVTRMPLGICYLVAHLKHKGHDVKVFDTTFYKCSDIQSDDKLREKSLQVKNPDLTKFGLTNKEADVFSIFEKEVKKFKPDIVGISVADPNYEFGLEFLQLVKNKFPKIITIAGGPTATLAPDEVIQQSCVDMLCIGEAEEAFTELCEKIENKEDIRYVKNIWVKEGNLVFKNPTRNLQDIDTILPPDLSVLDPKHFIRPLGGKVYRMGTVMWTRGCAYHCTYCANSSYINIYNKKGSFYRVKDPRTFVMELKDIKEKYDLNFLFFVDDIFPLHRPEMLNTFCRLYKKHVNIPFSINLHPLLIKEDQLKKVVDIGCVNICVGLESGSAEIRDKILGRKYSDEQIIKIFHMAKKLKIRSSSFNMIGLPHETREDIFKTIELNRMAGPNSATLTFFHPYRGSVLKSLCEKENLLDNITTGEENVYRSESRLNLPQISKEELRGLFNTFQLYFKLPKEYWGLIEMAEKDTELGREILDKILKPKFESLTEDDMVWDFFKRRKAWHKYI